MPKRALITGAAAGLGLAMARRLAADGHHVYMVDIAEAVVSHASKLREEKLSAEAIIMDVRDPAAISSECQRIVSQSGPVDILVNNAGLVTFASPEEGLVENFPLENWNRELAVNLTAPFLFCKALVPAMKQAGWGRIVNLSSRAGRTAIAAAGDPTYPASKAGIIGLTRALALQLAPFGITVNALAPGRFGETAMGDVPPEKLEAAVASIPVKRLGRPQELAALVSFLASEDSGYMTGAVFDINGGSFMG